MSFTVYTPEQIPDLINKCVDAKDFRPTSLVIARCEDEYLLVKSDKEDRDVWWPVQGGIKLDLGETPEEAAARELNEETRDDSAGATGAIILPDWVDILGAIEYRTRASDGYFLGKLLIACAVEYNPMLARLAPGDGVSDLRTASKSQLRKIMNNNVINPDKFPKAEFIKNMVELSSRNF